MSVGAGNPAVTAAMVRTSGASLSSSRRELPLLQMSIDYRRCDTELVGVDEGDYHHQNWASPTAAAPRPRWTGSTPDLPQEGDQSQGAGHAR